MGLLLRIHDWIARPRIALPDEAFELYAMTNWAMALGLVAHLSFIPLFLWLDAVTLAAINVVSVACFVGALALSRRARFFPSLMLGAVEVVAHAWIATIFFGWGPAFHFHAVLALQLVVLFTPVALRARLSIALVVAGAYVALVAVGTHWVPLSPLSTSVETALSVVNTIVFLAATTGMAAYHTWTVKVTQAARAQAQDELEEANAQLRAGEEALARARDEAVAASEAKSGFLANMSHELRTPLNAIIGYSEMIAEEASEQSSIDDAHKIHGAGRHLLTLINDVLDLSKIEAGRMDVTCVPFDLTKSIADVVATVTPLAQANDNELSVAVAPDIGEMVSDGTKVQQILMNLLSNAIKFTNHGTVSLAVTEEDRWGEPHVRMVVSDTGIGMEADALARIFLDFTQAESDTSAQFGGTGLGLAITKRFCELLGGNIDVESTPGRGSQFTVWLPLDASALSRIVAARG